MTDDIEAQLSALRAEAVALAGRPGDLVQRASVYHHLYRASGGNHVFPLIAAHGALWAGGYFRRNLALGAAATRAMTWLGANGGARLAALHALAEAFRDINRRVCVENWYLYHLTARADLAKVAEAHVPPTLFEQLARCHAARRRGVILTAEAKRALFAAFFACEQAEIVGPAVTQAFDTLDWRLARWVARRPRIAFAYLDAPLPFRDFADTAERVARGFAAYDGAARAGWTRVEESLAEYRIMPRAFVENSDRFFDSLRHRLAGAVA